MKGLLDRLRSGEVLISDGSTGTMLQERGVLTAGGCPELRNFDRPDVVEDLARLYVEAGSDIVHTNTFGGSALKLAMYGLDGRTEEINAEAVRLARKGAGEGAYVAVSCGPCGKILKPYGDVDPGTVYESFERQLRGAAGAGADLITVETMMDLEEAKLAVRAAKAVAPGLPVMATMTFSETPRGFRTIMGNTVELVAVELEAAGADILGSNCGNGSAAMVEIAREFKKFTGLPLCIQPNAGLPVVKEGKTIYPESPEFMAERAKELAALGVSIIGGCCGTTPEHIRVIRKEILKSKSI
jgi:5-methyltetrahydrofolate--homocysteine methyltransferase